MLAGLFQKITYRVTIKYMMVTELLSAAFAATAVFSDEISGIIPVNEVLKDVSFSTITLPFENVVYLGNFYCANKVP